VGPPSAALRAEETGGAGMFCDAPEFGGASEPTPPGALRTTVGSMDTPVGPPSGADAPSPGLLGTENGIESGGGTMLETTGRPGSAGTPVGSDVGTERGGRMSLI
jgi:hypothetical protein